MADPQLLAKVHQLGDLELALLLSLMAREHCLISTPLDFVDDLTKQLRLVAVRTFGLAPAVVCCHAHMTMDDFAAALLLPPAADLHAPGAGSSAPESARVPSSGNNPAARSLSRNSLNPKSHTGHHRHEQLSGAITPSSTSSAIPAGGWPASATTAVPTSATTVYHHPQAQIANLVLAKNLDCAPRAVQIQALELLRTRRILTRTAVQTAPKRFLLAGIIGAESGGEARVTQHLNDYFYLAHWHDLDDPLGEDDAETDEENDEDEGWRYERSDEGGESEVEEDQERGHSDGASIQSSKGSVLRRRSYQSSKRRRDQTRADESSDPPSRAEAGAKLGSPQQQQPRPRHEADLPADPARAAAAVAAAFTSAEIALLAQLGQQAHVDVDVTRYQMNLVAFLRTHRAVGGGVTPAATRHFGQLARHLAPLNGLDYVTPTLVGLAARKVYLHRVAVVEPARERSMQWGSDLAAIEALLEDVRPEDIIEDVLEMVAVPQ